MRQQISELNQKIKSDKAGSLNSLDKQDPEVSGLFLENIKLKQRLAILKRVIKCLRKNLS